MSHEVERLHSLCDSLAGLLSSQLSGGSSETQRLVELVGALQEGSPDQRLKQLASRLRQLRAELEQLSGVVERDHLRSIRQHAERIAAAAADGRLGSVVTVLTDQRPASRTAFCEAVLDQLLLATKAQRGVVVFYHPGSTGLEAAAQRGFGSLRKPLQELKLSHTVLREALRCREGVLYDDAASEARLLSARSLELRSILTAPLLQGEEAVGAIYLDNNATVGAFSRSDLHLVRGVGRVIPFFLHHSRLVPSRTSPRQKTFLEAAGAFDRIVAADPAMLAVLQEAARAARSLSAVLIEGETGTGKELVAEAVHLASERRDGPFVAVNCGAIPEALVESQLFGHEKGAFTGATQRHRGFVEEAQGGTLFLDEIGEMPLELQKRLLRLLRGKEYRRLGSQQLLTTDVRIVAATNRRLEDEVRAGRFRDDLYYRLNVIPLRVPSLRERKRDIAPLAGHFLDVFSRRAGREMEIDPAVLTYLEGYDFPGNVAELENLIERAVALAEDSVIRIGDLPQPLLERLDLGPDGLVRGLARAPRDPAELARQKQEAARALAGRELDLIRRLRGEVGMTEAARCFGMSRQHLYRRLEKLEKEIGGSAPVAGAQDVPHPGDRG